MKQNSSSRDDNFFFVFHYKSQGLHLIITVVHASGELAMSHIFQY
jgi:hypothetical protein